jgi:hypothetical protein
MKLVAAVGLPSKRSFHALKRKRREVLPKPRWSKKTRKRPRFALKKTLAYPKRKAKILSPHYPLLLWILERTKMP